MNAEVSFPSARRAWQAPGRNGLETGVRRARRHSRTVGMLRIGIPSAAAGVLILYMLAGWLSPLAMLPQLESAGLGLSGSQITMDQPRLAGYMRDGRAYELTAATALQDLTEPTFVTLQEIRGKVEMQGGETVEIRADRGNYDTKAETIMLRENVVVITSDGIEARMAQASVDPRNGRVTSDEAVEVVTEAGRLNARQMEVLEGGSLMRFQGGVTMNLSSPHAAAKRTELAQ